MQRRNIAHSQEKEKLIEPAPEEAQVLDLNSILHMLKELKETMASKTKGNRRTMSYQVENNNKEVEIIRGDQIEILELKSTSEMKNLLEGVQEQN